MQRFYLPLEGQVGAVPDRGSPAAPGLCPGSVRRCFLVVSDPVPGHGPGLRPQVLYDGKDVGDYDPAWLRKKVTLDRMHFRLAFTVAVISYAQSLFSLLPVG